MPKLKLCVKDGNQRTGIWTFSVIFICTYEYMNNIAKVKHCLFGANIS